MLTRERVRAVVGSGSLCPPHSGVVQRLLLLLPLPVVVPVVVVRLAVRSKAA